MQIESRGGGAELCDPRDPPIATESSYSENPLEDALPVPASDATSSPEGLDGSTTPGILPAPDLARPWREELAQRVENFRRRRARLRRGPGTGLNLGFDFQETGGADTEKDLGAEAIRSSEREQELDVSLEPPAGREFDFPILDALPLENTQGEPPLSEAEASDSPGDDARSGPVPLEILLESPVPATYPVPSPLASQLTRAAPLGRRALAGLSDTLVLLSAAGLFGIVFWRAGGRISFQPLNLLVLGFIAAFFILIYFGLFIALTRSTPGLIWMGLEVRNLEGGDPSTSQAAWRAFGYLLSVSSLMLGFIWALVDSESLTWHDRISGTCLAATQRDGHYRG